MEIEISESTKIMRDSYCQDLHLHAPGIEKTYNCKNNFWSPKPAPSGSRLCKLYKPQRGLTPQCSQRIRDKDKPPGAGASVKRQQWTREFLPESRMIV